MFPTSTNLYVNYGFSLIFNRLQMVDKVVKGFQDPYKKGFQEAADELKECKSADAARDKTSKSSYLDHKSSMVHALVWLGLGSIGRGTGGITSEDMLEAKMSLKPKLFYQIDI